MSDIERILVAPDPPQRGAEMEICYLFAGIGDPGPVVLVVTFDPPTGSGSVSVSPGSPCASIAVPPGALGVVIVDDSGQSADYGAPVVS